VIELDERGHDLKKSPNRSGSGRLGSGRLGSGRLGSGRLGSGRLGIVLQGRGWTGNAAVVTRPPVSALSSG
jgi:transposase